MAPRKTTRLLFLAVPLLLLVGCGQANDGATSTNPQMEVTGEPGKDVADGRGTLEDLAFPIDGKPTDHDAPGDGADGDWIDPCIASPGAFGCPCVANEDCDSGYCVNATWGSVCTQECIEECPEDWVCTGMTGYGMDLIFLCVPPYKPLCTPCVTDADCAEGRCVQLDGAPVCVYACDHAQDCPPDFLCGPLAQRGPQGYCQPLSLSCTCLADHAGQQRPCTVANEFGECDGYEVCEPEVGWDNCSAPEPEAELCDGLDNDCDGQFDEDLPESTPCSQSLDGVGTCEGAAFCMGPDGWVCTAPTPAPESCDFKDNDCDGEVDEDYKTGDKYTHINHCGTCLQDCVGTVPNGTAMCDAASATPVCVVAECDEGYYQLGQFQCLPEGETLCKPCASDLACEGGKCVAVGEGMFCTQSCSDEPCPDFFLCQDLPGLTGKWCLPMSSTCDCSKVNSGSTRPCSVSNEVGTCFGYETCDPEVGWVGCTAATAELELCDGLDNDCNGVPDDGLPEAEPCTIAEEGVGSCTGIEVCMGNQGWLCNAAKPEPESCDYQDNDCDDEVDEDFKVDGKYGSLLHCGECNKSCVGSLPNAVAFCDTGEATPLCKVEECLDGTWQLNEFQCITPPDVQCAPCEDDGDCYFASCTPMEDGQYCLAPCADGLCDEGYSCQENEAGEPICVPVSNTCQCSAENVGATRSCSATNEFGICFGVETCQGDAGWSACSAAIPAAEVCDALDNDCNGQIDDGLPPSKPCVQSNDFGICEGLAICLGVQGWVCGAPIPAAEVCDYADNDCDGHVDEDFKSGSKYVHPEHCGACNNGCFQAIDNATAACAAEYLVPKCVVDTCDDGYFKLNQFECIIPPNTSCAPCASDADCIGSYCVQFDGKKRCAFPCFEDDDCGPEFACGSYGELGDLCQPISGSCECSSEQLGEKRSCSVSNDIGECYGYETCQGTEGWSACDAAIPALEICDGLDNDCNWLVDDAMPPSQPCVKNNQWGTCSGEALCKGSLGWVCQAATPAPESCDYLDNDCDGLTDEDFLVDDKYATLHHCGSCGKDCEGALPNAAETWCDGTENTPVCKVAQCAPGTWPLNEYQCIVPPDVQCNECDSDADCYFAQCLPVDQGTFCIASCADQECAAGYQCQEVPGAGPVCLPVTGSCACSTTTAGTKRGCSQENEFGLCYGFETCLGEEGWSPCDAAIPAAELCDGLDNDCNGLVDDALPGSMPCTQANQFGSCDGQALCMGLQGWVCQAKVPAAELCDYVDNDCDGLVDEDFMADGKYVADDHCGTCNNVCFDAIPNAMGVCDPAYPVPKCVVAQCAQGYYQLSPFQCIVPPNTTCQACTSDADCLGSTCVELDGKLRCAFPCLADDDCTGETHCAPYPDEGLLCQPLSGSCECSSQNEGSKRSCSVSNEIGTCFGFQTCVADTGWTDCDALDPALESCDGTDNDCNGIIDDGLPVTVPCAQDNEFGSCPGQAVCGGNAGWLCQAPLPAQEACDYVDNDCDGEVDEDFIADGKYGLLHHCGSCNNDCQGALPNAIAACDASAPTPVCKVDTCLEGYFPLNEYQCIEPPDVQCSQCASDADCYFAACIPLDQGDYCLHSCQEGDCTTGYHCEEVAGFGLRCLPDTLSCECGPDTAGETRSCSVSNEHGTCFGLETCQPDTGWSACSAAVPTVEECDGLDNDCNGLLDDGLPTNQPCTVTNEYGTCAGISVCMGNSGWICQAPEPQLEACDYMDNDCDGETDETFKEQGKYVTDLHCGTCYNACANAIPNATGTCDASYLVPKCVVASCDPGYYQISPFQCVVPPDTTCQACSSDSDCLGSTCLTIDGQPRCAMACESDDDCAGETACSESPGVGTVCLPISGSCECNSFTAGSKRSCSVTNPIGTCYGFQTCAADTGWSDCDALEPTGEICDGVDNDCNGLIDDALPESEPCEFSNEFGTCAGQATCIGQAGWVCQASVPAAESCDYVDNDCDGGIDENFRNNAGEYNQFEHCGSCTISCAGGFPNATAMCDDSLDTPQCVVAECDPGYFKLNAFQCIPNTASLCEPCSTDDNCVLDGAMCVQLDDGLYCSKHCEGAEDCPAGYECQPYEDDMQCIPLTNSCECDGTNTDLARSCSVTWPGSPQPGEPFTTCYGSQFCQVEGWSDCVLPDEVCDGQDNDCNGVIDDGFLVDGKYSSDTHCGQCGNNCTFLQYPHAQGVCDAAQTIPDCTMECDVGYYDVNANPADGCECDYQGAEDLPDGIDQNCDGVDGEVLNSVFVAKNGSDINPGTVDEPMLTIQGAIDRANDTGLRDVYVATGVYNGSLLLRQGIRVYGGYSSDFLQRDTILYETVVMAGTFTEQLPGAVNGIAIGGEPGSTRFDGFTIFGRNNNSVGGSSYTFYLRDSGEGLQLSNNHLVAGSGGNGQPGANGSDGADGSNGSPGEAAFTYNSKTCTVGTVSTGGSGATNTCFATDVSGGNGGDSTCPEFTAPDANENGDVGAGPAPGTGGAAGWDGQFVSNCSQCYVPSGDHPSEGADGASGQSGPDGGAGSGCSQPDGQVVNGLWQPLSGVSGGGGDHGSGGGGGGSGGGADVTQSYLGCNDQIGGTGGGGGSGGCAGTGGSAGGSAGGSFGIFLYFTTPPGTVPTLTANLVEAGIGGAGAGGGNGGTGGVGGAGALGGAPGVGTAWCAYGGGTGGDGGNGGHGGGGGGGCGGVSYCIYAAGQGGTDLSGYLAPANTCIVGSGGPGGPGGPSIGQPGGTGQTGPSASVNW